MYISHLAGASLLCAAASWGCTDHGSVTAPADANAPAGMSQRSGAIVDKSIVIASWFGGGPPTNLAVQVGSETSVEDFCADPSSGVFSPQRGVVVVTPSGETPAHVVTREALVFVFEYSAGIVTDQCVLVGAPVVATGRVFFEQSLNQFPGPGTGPGSFIVHITVHGIVDLTAGGQARLQGSAQFVLRPDGSLVKDQEPVTLTPI